MALHRVKNKLHILSLTSWYPHHTDPDNGDFIQRHLKAISTLHQISVVYAVKDSTQKNKFQIEEKNNQNLKEIIVSFRPSSVPGINFYRKCKAYLKGIQKINNFDLIHLQVVFPAGLIAVKLKKRFKKRIVYTEHWTGFTPQIFKKTPFYKKILIREILKKVDFVCPVSEDLRVKINKVYPIKNYKIIPNVVEIEKFSFQKESITNKNYKFLHLSHLGDEHKNISGILRVTKKLIQEGFGFELHIGGTGDLSPIYKFIKANHFQQYIFPFARLSHSEVNAKMKQADCFVLFSNFENQPCVQIEAFASGIPVIATDVGGIREFFPENFGILIEKRNEQQLYEAMKSAIKGRKFSSPEAMNKYAGNNFSVQSIAKEYDEVYKIMLK